MLNKKIVLIGRGSYGGSFVLGYWYWYNDVGIDEERCGWKYCLPPGNGKFDRKLRCVGSHCDGVAGTPFRGPCDGLLTLLVLETRRIEVGGGWRRRIPNLPTIRPRLWRRLVFALSLAPRLPGIGIVVLRRRFLFTFVPLRGLHITRRTRLLPVPGCRHPTRSRLFGRLYGPPIRSRRHR